MFDEEFDRLFRRMSGSFMGIDDLLDEAREAGGARGPFYYGYTMTVGPDGKPVVKEYGNVRPGLAPTSGRREPLVDTVVDEKEKTVKMVAEMPGVEKADVKVVVDGDAVSIEAERGKKKYSARVPLRRPVDRDSARASYRNGILELSFRLDEPERPKGKTVEVQ